MGSNEKRIWIVVIQSLPEKDSIKSGRGLSIDLEAMCSQSNRFITSIFKEVSSFDELKIAFNEILDTIQDSDHLIIHIDSHGDECGIGLGQEFVFWDVFVGILSLLYDKTRHNLILVLSTCRGFSLSTFSSGKNIPCSSLIASKKIINGGVAGRAFRKFYREYINSLSVSKAFNELTAYYEWFEESSPFELLSFDNNVET